MKKSIFLVFLSCLLSYSSYADDGGSCGDNVKWYYDESNSTLTIYGCGSMKDYTVSLTPWSSYSDYIKTVVIKNGVSGIGGKAFCNCSYLKDVTIPNSVRIIETKAFEHCTSLEKVTIPSSVHSIDYAAFFNCASLSSIEFSEGLKLIGYAAFQGCISLNSVIIPSTLEHIGTYAFADCYDLHDVFCYASNPPKVIGHNINDIFALDYPFHGSIVLHIPDQSIDTYMNSGYWKGFKYYQPLSQSDPRPSEYHISSLNCGEKLFWYYSIDTKTLSFSGEGSMWDYDLSNLTPWNDYKDDIEKLILDENIAYIGNYAFYNCNRIDIIESQITNPFDINDNTFAEETYNKAELFVPTGTRTEYQSKSGWNHFNKILDGVRTINVEKAGTLSELISEEEKYKIESLILTGEINGEDLGLIREMAGGGTYSEKSTFLGARHNTEGKLEKLDMSGVKIIAGGNMGYYDDGNNAGYIKLDDNDIIPPAMFCYCILKSIYLPETIIEIDRCAFWGCNNLEFVSIPSTVCAIGNNVFTECYFLKKVRSNLKTPFDIEENVFENRTYDNAELIVPEGTESDYMTKEGWRNFNNITLESGLNIDDKGEEFEIDHIKYRKVDDNIVSVIRGDYDNEGNLSIPDQIEYNGINYIVNSIGEEAFSKCENLHTVTIPSTVTTIGNAAFFNCIKLNQLEIPNSVTSIGDYAFYGCSNLERMVIPNSVSSIGEYAFCDCRNLIAIDLPNGITTIAEGLFSGCERLWSIDIPNGVTAINNDAFLRCTKLSNATIPNSVMTIGNSAFSYCSLGSVTIPSNLSSIGYFAFSNNSYLQSVISYTTEPLNIDEMSVFNFVNIGQCMLNVPYGCKEKYEEANVWKDFFHIIEIDAETGINSKTIDKKKYAVYNINGHKVKLDKMSTDDLPKGLYIINGKKILNK